MQKATDIINQIAADTRLIPLTVSRWRHTVLGDVPLPLLTEALGDYEAQGWELCGVVQRPNAAAMRPEVPGHPTDGLIDPTGRPAQTNGTVVKQMIAQHGACTLIFKRPTGLTVPIPEDERLTPRDSNAT